MAVDFLFELGQLKRVRRSGWWLIGIKDPESVAEHCFRTAAVGHLLSRSENADERKVLLMCLYNDLPETRLNDLHKVGHRYIDFRKAEIDAIREQVLGLPKNGRADLLSLLEEYAAQSSPEAVVARDADLLENALQAKEYMKQGYCEAEDWLENISKLLRTDSGIRMLEEIRGADPDAWWKGLKKAER